MKKILISLACFAFLIGLSGSAGAAIPVSGCTPISSSGVYVLSQDLTSTTSSCIIIKSSNVVFDGQGHSITGPRVPPPAVSYAGVYVYKSYTTPLSNVTVKNVTVTGEFYAGIYYFNADNGGIIDNNVLGNWYGIIIDESSNFTVTNNTVINNRYVGLWLAYSSSNLIYNNLFNNQNNAYIYPSYSNDWNTTKTAGANIVGGPYLGGNYWAHPILIDFSETCTDVDSDGICDSSYPLASGNVDYLPLTVYTTPVINATIDISPSTLNLKNQGKWIRASISLPEGYRAEDIDIDTILLEGFIPVVEYDIKGSKLIVKFYRHDIQMMLKPGDETLKVTGKLYDSTPFEGSDIIKVISS